MAHCDKCGSISSGIIKTSDGNKCFACFELESPIIDEAWRIIKDVLDNRVVWIDFHAIEQLKRQRAHR